MLCCHQQWPNMTPETAKEIQLEATKALRAETHCLLKISCTDASSVSIWGGDGCLLQVDCSRESSTHPAGLGAVVEQVYHRHGLAQLSTVKMLLEKQISTACFDLALPEVPAGKQHKCMYNSAPTGSSGSPERTFLYISNERQLLTCTLFGDMGLFNSILGWRD